MKTPRLVNAMAYKYGSETLTAAPTHGVDRLVAFARVIEIQLSGFVTLERLSRAGKRFTMPAESLRVRGLKVGDLVETKNGLLYRADTSNPDGMRREMRRAS